MHVACNGKLAVFIAESRREINQAQALRYEVFTREYGAKLSGRFLDQDRYDPFCRHLVVADKDSGKIIATTRLLTKLSAAEAGGYYSENEFDIGNIARLPGRLLEIGRTCVHPDYRGGMTIGVLWTGLARYVAEHHINYLMGCASIGVRDGGHCALAVMDDLRERYFVEPALRVTPKLPLPVPKERLEAPAIVPPLLRSYLRLGAKVCGEPCWDPDFQVADVFVLLDLNQLSGRYARHFFQSALLAA